MAGLPPRRWMANFVSLLVFLLPNHLIQSSATLCGGNLTAPSGGPFTTPTYRSNYYSNVICEWRIAVPEGNTILLTFDSFNFTYYDAILNIYDGANTSAAQLKSLRRSASVRPITSTSNVMFLRFTLRYYPYDFDWTNQEFEFSYTSNATAQSKVTPTNATECGGNLTAASGSTLTSPNYPSDYGNDENCEWWITGPTGSTIRLMVDSFNIEPEFDVLNIYDGDCLIAAPLVSLTGSQSARNITSTSNVMFLRFTSDGSVTDQGFQISYTVIPNSASGCGGNLTSSSLYGEYFQSPNYPCDYGNNETCEWLITVPAGNIIHLDVDFHIEENSDFLTIYDGSDVFAGQLRRFTGSQWVSSITSSTNAMFLKFTSDEEGTARGFNINYRSQRCGGELTDLDLSRGPFASPNYPSNYSDNERCYWTINVPRGKIVRLTFDSFDVEEDRDFLNIYDGQSLLRRLTGQKSVINITSTFNWMGLSFKSDENGTAQGFQFSYTIHTAHMTPDSYSAPGCGRYHLTNHSGGPFTSPNYPGNNGNNEICEWQIVVPEGRTILLTFDSFDVEENGDVLTIYDRYRSRILRRLSGPQPVSPITSSCNVMFLRFTSDYSDTAQGFQFSYTSYTPYMRPTNATGCGGSLTAPSGVITSPNYPSNYGNNEICEWQLVVPEGSKIRLTFESFDVEDGYDFLIFYDGASGCSPSITASSPITSTSNVMFVRFTSDEVVTARGFQLFYTNYTCGGNLTAPSGGPFTSPNYPSNYDNNEICEWRITVPEGSTILLTFDRFDVAGNGDVMTIDGHFSQIRLSHSQPVSPITSSCNVMLLTFTSDDSGTAHGFQFFYTSYTPYKRPTNATGCGGVLKVPSGGTVTSPNYPSNYNKNEICEWLIIVPTGNKVQLTIDSFEVDNSDYLQVFDEAGACALELPWSRQTPATLTSKSNVMFVRFTSDELSTAKGFQFFYTSYTCGGTLTAPSGGPFTSPNYPSNYSASNEDCEWRIIVPVGNKIRLTFDSINIDDYGSWLSIYDGCVSNSSLIESITGAQPVIPITSTSNMMSLWWSAWSATPAQGFRFSYTSQTTGCGGNLTTPSAVVTSPNYPSNYSNDVICQWLITVPTGNTIRLTFDSFDVEGNGDVLTIYDGPCDCASPLRLTGSQSVSPINSKSNAMFVKFTSDENGTAQGFRFSYTSHTAHMTPTNASGCGSTMTAPTGDPFILRLPLHPPNSYGYSYRNEDCEWWIIVQAGSIIRLTFDSFDIKQNFLTIFDGTSPCASILRSFTGLQPSSSVTSTSNEMFVRFTYYINFMYTFHTSYELQFSYTSQTTPTNVTACGGNLTAPSGGPFTTPTYPSDYGNYEICEWRIAVSEGSTILLTFDSFDVEDGYDFLSIYDGANASDSQLRSFTGSQSVGPITSTSHVMFLRFTSDYIFTSQGFQFSYTSQRKACPVPPVLQNGNRTEGHLYGDVVTFSCDEGFELIGSVNRTCHVNESWSGVQPTCSRNVCPQLISPEHGSVHGGRFYGDVVTYSCDSGYEISGPQRRTCLSDQTWSSTKPTCRGFCKSEVVATGAGQLSFPRADGESFSYSSERCNSSAENEKPLASRFCRITTGRSVVWDPPVVLTCDVIDLRNLSKIIVTNETALSVATELQVITIEAETLSSDDITNVSTIVQEIVEASATEQIGNSLLTTVDNLIKVNATVLQQSQQERRGPTRVIQALETFADTVILTTERYTAVRPGVALQAADISPEELDKGQGFAFFLSGDDSNSLKEGNIRSFTTEDGRDFVQTADISISIPPNLSNMIQIDNTSDVRLSYTLYNNNSLFVQTSPGAVGPSQGTVGTRVIGGRIAERRVKNLPLPVIITFAPLQHLHPEDVREVRCVFWDFEAGAGQGAWSTDGCMITNQEQVNGRYRCACNHLTNFAVIFDVFGVGFGEHKRPLEVITIVGCVVSIVCLVLTLASFVVTRKYKRHARAGHAKNQRLVLMNLCVALLAILVIFLVGINQTASPIGCTVVAALLHYFLLAALVWMAVEAVNIYRAVVLVFDHHVSETFIIKAAAVAWGLPLVATVSTAGPSSLYQYKMKNVCWLAQTPLIYAFLLPAGLILLFNLLVFVIVMCKLARDEKKLKQLRGAKVTEADRNRIIRQIRRAFSIMALFGLTWVFGFFVINDARAVFAYLFCIFNTLQGLFIFIFHCVMRDDMKKWWKKWWQNLICTRKKKQGLYNVNGSTTFSSAPQTSQTMLVRLSTLQSNSKPDHEPLQ